jgi:hypothetical protein
MKNLNKSLNMLKPEQNNKQMNIRTVSVQNIEVRELQNAIAHLQCLSKELEIYSDSLNHLPDFNSPLGNLIQNSLQEIENKLLSSCAHLNDSNHRNQMREEELNNLRHQNGCLSEKMKEIQHLFDKKLDGLNKELDSKKKELVAATLLAKALKRDKRKQHSVKNYLYDYNLMKKHRVE